MNTQQIAAQADQAKIHLAALPGELKNRAIADIARALRNQKDQIETVNRSDLDRAQKEQLAAPLLKRLKFDAQKIEEACQGLESLTRLADPVGETMSAIELDRGLELRRTRCPIGVIGVVFESRPDALVQIAALCLKSGNAVLLKGGSEASATNRLLADIIHQSSVSAGLPENWIGLLETRTQVEEMLGLNRFINLIVPRGSNAFVQHIMKNTTIPVLGHADGICHVYIDRYADLEMALNITIDSKCQYVSVCNAAETLLVHQDIAETFLPLLKPAFNRLGVEIRGCKQTAGLIDVVPATEADWGTEYLDLIISIKVVQSMAQGIDHINRYGSGHTDVIVSADRARGEQFMDLVDSGDVFVNCSSRFSDGFRYGLGAEVGISTNKIHARGPVGLEGLTIYKWKLTGNGHVVADYTGENAKAFTHRKLD